MLYCQGMANPNSLLTRLRRYAVTRLQPAPDPGEAWCVGCTLNGGRTLIISADGFRDHSAEHTNSEGSGYVEIIARWPGNRSGI